MPTPKLTIACELLDRALRLYYEGDSDFAALHLAGAAEELLGKYVEAFGGESSFANLQSAAIRLSKYINEDGTESTPKAIAGVMNRAKNATKHMEKTGKDHVTFNARTEAHDLLDRAVSNYYQAMDAYDLPETELIWRFSQERASGV
ncbi:hypothetical protein [Vogesella oryzae]|uniref:hypothetical protein n=1 Tax=Vogesella oryzae TaxID=1735285 RepID=UPI001C2E5C88|nr:hypothetical protein [Vogesella oryzae]